MASEDAASLSAAEHNEEQEEEDHTKKATKEAEEQHFSENGVLQQPVLKIVKRVEPTARTHSSANDPIEPDWFPSGDEDENLGFLDSEDDDSNEPMSFIIPSGRKTRAEKAKPRKWYDESRLNPEQQFCLKLCFKDVYQFRSALLNFHIKQLRSFRYHRNCKDRVIAWCDHKDKGCPFYIVASQIKNEQTFCVKKFRAEHTCPTSDKHSKVSSKWLGSTILETIRSDPNTTVPALVDKAKRKFGIEVPKMMAWRAKKAAKEIVLGDHKKQYHRLTDYIETVKICNPRSRCIVTTVTPKSTNENPHPGPRFHGLFFCLNAPREGFLNGCRPFIGLDGCFIKLTTGAQILAATGRDANNNMYPIAFGIVGVEDTPSWSWFLTQLKYALGGTEEGKFGKYTIMSDRQKVSDMLSLLLFTVYLCSASKI